MTPFELAGVELPRIGLGTNRLTTAAEHVAFVREAVAAGLRHIDTAHVYTGGDSERAVGEALEGTAEDVLVATKGGYGGPGQGRPDVLAAQIEQSLRSLRTEAIGLYYLHRVDPETPLEESLGAIKGYVDRGAIRHVGISAVSVEQIERAREVLPIAAVQNEYNLAKRDYDDVVDHCGAVGDVEDQRGGGAGLGLSSAQAVGVAVDEDERRALAGERVGRRAADAGRPAGDHHDLAVEPQIHAADPISFGRGNARDLPEAVLLELDHPGAPLGDLAVAHDEHLGHRHAHLAAGRAPGRAGELRHDDVVLLDHPDDLQLGRVDDVRRAVDGLVVGLLADQVEGTEDIGITFPREGRLMPPWRRQRMIRNGRRAGLDRLPALSLAVATSR
jgi:pyridoxine 4-dehydrogenase